MSNAAESTIHSGTSSQTPLERSPFANVLVPVDFSPSSRAAFSLAVRMTEAWGSEVIVFNAPGMSENDSFLQGTGAPWTKSDVLAEARDHLRSFAETVVPGSGPRVRVEARRDDDFVSSVVEACKQLGASIVILGAERAKWPRWRRSRAERVARAVPCPVLVVPIA